MLALRLLRNASISINISKKKRGTSFFYASARNEREASAKRERSNINTTHTTNYHNLIKLIALLYMNCIITTTIFILEKTNLGTGEALTTIII